MTHPLRILVLDDEPKLGKILTRILEREGHRVQAQTDPKAALEMLGRETFDLLITDLKMPGMDGLEVMTQARARAPDLDAIMMTAYATVETAVQAMKEGAFDYLIKPFPNEELVMVVARIAERRGLRRENRLLKQTLRTQFGPEGIVAASPAMRDLMRRVEKVAVSDVSVLLRGESGTGKDVLAMAIHAAGPRCDRPMVKVNCGALTETLLESELFGHTRGAFTGAVATRDGLFQEADGGTIFLDEIGEISPALQIKLLRVLQSGEYQRVGDARTFQVNVRVLAATNRPLEQMIEEGRFRSDLYYRLNVVPLEIAPLRERREDIPALIDHFLQRLRRQSDRSVTLTPEVFELFQTYDWPGNIRELENALEHAFVMCEGDRIEPADLPVAIQNAQNTSSASPTRVAASNGATNQALTLEEIEKQALVEALETTGFNHTRAARLLGVTRRTLGYRLKKYNIARQRNQGESS